MLIKFFISLLILNLNIPSSEKAGSTIAYFNTETFYDGVYLLNISSENYSITKRVIISR